MTTPQARPKGEVDVDGSDSARIARGIVRSRALDDFVGGLARRSLVAMHSPAGAIEGHLYGALAALRPGDWAFGDVRMSAIAVERGLAVRQWLAMLLGTASAPNRGHASPSEVGSPGGLFVPSSSLLGTHLAHAGGVAHGMKVKGRDDCAIAWFGPGAAAAPDAHVAFNFAGVFRTPTIFYYCRSGDPAADDLRLGGESFAERGEGYGIPGVVVDGADPLAVRDAVADAAALARSGGGPTMIEGLTGADPLDALNPSAAAVESWTVQLETELRDAADVLLAEGPPPLASLFEDVFAATTDRLNEQRAGLEAHTARFGAGVID